MQTLTLKSLLKTLFSLLVLFSFSSAAEAKEMQGRLGVGYNGQMANSRNGTKDIPGVSAKYALTRDIAFEGILGFSSGGSNKNSGLGLKAYKNLFYEQHLNFYFFGLLGAVSANGNSGYDLQSGFGTEIFVPGIDSIGISFEFGGELTNISGSTVASTVGFSFIQAGMRFYF